MGLLGALIGIAGSQLIPVADTLAEALTETGLGPRAAWAIILCLFAVGGVEGSLLLRPFIAHLAGRRGVRAMKLRCFVAAGAERRGLARGPKE